MYLQAIVICASVFVIQTVTAQSCCNPIPLQCGCPDIIPYCPRVSCATLTVSPTTLPGAPNIPATMNICSDDLLIAGPVIVAGKLPFAGTVALEGALPAYGAGSVAYGCGDGIVLAESPLGPGIGAGYLGGYGCGGIIY